MTSKSTPKAPAIGLDERGVPLIGHRPYYHFQMQGGGTWVVKSSVIVDIVPFMTGHPFAHHYDGHCAVSGAASLVSKALLPRHRGSTEPAQFDFKQPREEFIAECQASILADKRVKTIEMLPDRGTLKPLFAGVPVLGKIKALNQIPLMSYMRGAGSFFNHRLVADAKHGGVRSLVNLAHNFNVRAHAFYGRQMQGLTDIFDPLRIPHEPQNPEISKTDRLVLAGIRAAFGSALGWTDAYSFLRAERIRQAQEAKASTLETTTDRKLNNIADRKRDNVHMDAKALKSALEKSLKVEVPNSGERVPASMDDVVAPFIIPTINTNGKLGDEWTRWTRAPIPGQTQFIRPRLREMYREGQPLARAAFLTCLMPAVYSTQEDPDSHDKHSDGASVYSPGRGAKDMLELYSRQQAFTLTTYDCNMSNRPPRVTGADLDNNHLIGAVANALALNVRTARRADDLDIEGDPRCKARVEFGRPVMFDTPNLPPGRLRDSLDRFARHAVDMPLDECLNIHVPPVLDTSSQIDCSPATMRMYKAAGVQAVVRNLPDIVAHVKHLVVRGPLSDRLGPSQQADLLTHIDVNFPPQELKAMRNARVYDDGIDPALHGQYVDPDEADLVKRILKMRRGEKQTPPQGVAASVTEFTMGK